MAFYKKSININKQKISAQPKKELTQLSKNTTTTTRKKEQKAKMENDGGKEKKI